MKSKFESYLTEAEDLFEFSNIYDRRTGLTNIVVHVYSQGEVKIPHGARVKVSNVYNKFRMDDCFVVDIKTRSVIEGEVKISSKELKQVKNWIDKNKKILIEYWNSGAEMDTDSFLDSIIKV
jgi:hypothetical protein